MKLASWTLLTKGVQHYCVKTPRLYQKYTKRKNSYEGFKTSFIVLAKKNWQIYQFLGMKNGTLGQPSGAWLFPVYVLLRQSGKLHLKTSHCFVTFLMLNVDVARRRAYVL